MLYLYSGKASLLILVPNSAGILIQIWKIAKATGAQLRIRDPQSLKWHVPRVIKRQSAEESKVSLVNTVITTERALLKKIDVDD